MAAKRSSQVFLLGGALGVALVFSPRVFAVALMLLFSVTTLTVLVMLVGGAAREPLTRWVFLCLAAHLGIGAIFLLSKSILLYLAPDGLTYHSAALSILQKWTLDSDLSTAPITGGKEGFVYLLAWLYRAFGPYPVVGIIANATLISAAVPIVFDTTRRLFGPAAARSAMPIVVLLPGFLLWPSPLLREAGVLLLLALVANFAVRLAQRAEVVALAGLALALPLLFTFRGHIALVTLATVIIGVSFGRREVFAGFSTGLTAIGVLAFMVLSLGLGYSGYRSSVRADLREAQSFRSGIAASGGSGFDPGARISSPDQAVLYLPRALPQFLFGPFPWQIRSFRQAPVFAETLAWLVLTPATWAGLRIGWRLRGRQLLPLLIPAAGVAATLSLVAGNFGYLVRERPQLIILLVPLTACGIAERARGRGRDGAALEVSGGN